MHSCASTPTAALCPRNNQGGLLEQVIFYMYLSIPRVHNDYNDVDDDRWNVIFITKWFKNLQ